MMACRLYMVNDIKVIIILNLSVTLIMSLLLQDRVLFLVPGFTHFL